MVDLGLLMVEVSSGRSMDRKLSSGGSELGTVTNKGSSLGVIEQPWSTLSLTFQQQSNYRRPGDSSPCNQADKWEAPKVKPGQRLSGENQNY